MLVIVLAVAAVALVSIIWGLAGPAHPSPITKQTTSTDTTTINQNISQNSTGYESCYLVGVQSKSSIESLIDSVSNDIASNASVGIDCCALNALKWSASMGYIAAYNLSNSINVSKLYSYNPNACNGTIYGLLSGAEVIPASVLRKEHLIPSNTQLIYAGEISNPLWSGYVITYNNSTPKQVVTQVNGSWIVQTARSPSGTNTYSGQWVGIGGTGNYTFSNFIDKSLIQTGTASQNATAGQPYYAWWELLPQKIYGNAAVIANFTVQPGDLMHAEIRCIANCTSNANVTLFQTWNITIEDLNASEHDAPFTHIVRYNSSMLTADWIDENPKYACCPMTYFGTANFSNSYAMANGSYKSISGFHYYNATIYLNPNTKSTTVAYPASLSTSGSNFAVIRAQPFVVVLPVKQAVDKDQNATIRSAIYGGMLPLTYQWYAEAPGNTSFTAAEADALLGNGTTSGHAQSPNATFPTGHGKGIGQGEYQFELQVTDSNNPKDIVNSTTAIVQLFPPLSVLPYASSYTIVDGQGVKLFANASGGSGANNFTYTWASCNPPACNGVNFVTLNNKTASQITEYPNTTTKYWVGVTDNGTYPVNYSVRSANITITVKPPPKTANITITNGQSVATPAPFQQKLDVHSDNFSAYEDGNLDNVEFLYLNGTVIPSWLESANSRPMNKSTDTVYWLRLGPGIKANSSMKIQIAFAPMGTDLLNSQTTGEAPQLSPTYGEYDDGASVFNFYDNFAGTSFNHTRWNKPIVGAINNSQYVCPIGSGSLTVNNSLTESAESGANKCASAMHFYTKSTYAPSVLETLITKTYAPSSGSDAVGWNIAYDASAPITGKPAVEGYTNAYYFGGQGEMLTSPFESQITLIQNGGGVGTLLVGSTPYVTTGIMSLAWPGTGNERAYVNYGQTLSSSDSSLANANSYIDLVFNTANDTIPYSVTYQWVRTRAYPPNGVMPGAKGDPPWPGRAVSSNAANSAIPLNVTVRPHVIPTTTIPQRSVP